MRAVSHLSPAAQAAAPPRRSRLTIKEFQQYISCAKIIVAEIASFIGLVALLLHGLMKEIRW